MKSFLSLIGISKPKKIKPTFGEMVDLWFQWRLTLICCHKCWFVGTHVGFKDDLPQQHLSNVEVKS